MTAADLPESLVPAARALLSDRVPLAARYAELLGTQGVVRGLIGPREASRIWDRHVLNCAAIASLIPEGSSVVDVGSGAGLPGIVLAIARPDLTVILLEPLARRTAFLTEAVAVLGLESQVSVARGRAEEYVDGAAGRLPLADVVTARALAPLDRLVGWCLPLAAMGGRVLAIKGESAAQEVATHRGMVARLGGGVPVIQRCAEGVIDPPTTVVEIARERVAGGPDRRRPDSYRPVGGGKRR